MATDVQEKKTTKKQQLRHQLAETEKDLAETRQARDRLQTSLDELRERTATESERTRREAQATELSHFLLLLTNDEMDAVEGFLDDVSEAHGPLPTALLRLQIAVRHSLSMPT